MRDQGAVAPGFVQSNTCGGPGNVVLQACVSSSSSHNSVYCEELLGMKQGPGVAGGLGLLQRNGWCVRS